MLVVGHTDKTGLPNYNQSLSERRARSVFAYLTSGRDAAAKAAALKEWNTLRRRATGRCSCRFPLGHVASQGSEALPERM